MLRISRVGREGEAVVRVEGCLDGEGADLLRKECREAGGAPTLDLSALLSADDVGLASLRSLRASGAVLTGASPFLQLLLEGPKARKRGSSDAA